jgi:hypothetical protein
VRYIYRDIGQKGEGREKNVEREEENIAKWGTKIILIYKMAFVKRERERGFIRLVNDPRPAQLMAYHCDNESS